MADDTGEPCPKCGSTNTDTQEEEFRSWVLDATCRGCGHKWKQSN